MRIKVTDELTSDANVCLIGGWKSLSSQFYTTEVEQSACHCKELYPNTPIVIVGNHVDMKRDLKTALATQRGDDEFMNQTVKNQLVNAIRANKFVEFFCETCREAKNPLNEIALVRFEKLKNEKTRKKLKTVLLFNYSHKLKAIFAIMLCW